MSKISRLGILLLAGLLLLGIVVPTVSHAANPAVDPATVVQNLAGAAIRIARDQTLNQAQQHTAFYQLFVEHFDMSTVGRFVLAQDWNRTSAAQKRQFEDVFPKFMIANYASRFQYFGADTLTIQGVNIFKTGQAAVASTIQRAGAPGINVSWRLHQVDGHWRVVDVVVEGFSMVITHRREFSFVIEQSGVRGLLRALAKKTEGFSGCPATQSC